MFTKAFIAHNTSQPLPWLDFRNFNVFFKQFMNHRETYSNIMLITTAVTITRKSYLSIDEIRQGIIAYTLISRECKHEFLPMYVEKIIKAFRVRHLFAEKS